MAATEACHRELAATGAELSAYNSTESAADFADLRKVLGYCRWNVYGTSYGSYLAQTLMRDHPEGHPQRRSFDLGSEAERLAGHERNAGWQDDLGKIRSWAKDTTPSSVWIPDSWVFRAIPTASMSWIPRSNNSLEKALDEIMETARVLAESNLRKNWDVLMAVSDELMNTGEIYGKRYKEIQKERDRQTRWEPPQRVPRGQEDLDSVFGRNGKEAVLRLFIRIEALVFLRHASASPLRHATVSFLVLSLVLNVGLTPAWSEGEGAGSPATANSGSSASANPL